ncbi:ParM/StbA family protein [Limosilactobacillus mucosae]|uniref:ParM/StbA family protein n=1 Tax=Limosilactobacillus mucosae TaxID=97478 RepID=A0AAJ1HT09_LIMMU|nr:ParM/StbA family protein [Limosilactobacillus mucosae]MDC2828969.1 ParM/StbA family protein [Limosilactobacillus mucosae]
MENTILVANDLGYGSVKAVLNGEHVQIPSVTAMLRSQDIQDPVEFSNADQKKKYFEDIYNHMDVSIESPAISEKKRILVGSSAVRSPLSLNRFDVNDLAGKSEDDLAVILTLSMIAAKKLKDAYENGEDLSNLTTKVIMTTALPVNEGKQNNASNRYKQRYLNGPHKVTFHNFKEEVTVSISFDKVLVALEGETAQFYLINADQDLKKDLEKNFKDQYGEEISADDLIHSRNVLGIDIGEGTTDIVSIVEGRANGLASQSLEMGYGNVLQEALQELQNERINITDRSKLKDFLNSPTNSLNKNRKKHVKDVVNEQLTPFVNNIVQTTSSVMRKSGVPVELIYVYGGGSIPMDKESNLREQLEKKLKAFSGAYEIPIIWVDSKHAQFMNERGLELILKSLS